MAVDDLQVPAVKSAFVAFCKRYGLTPTREKTQVRRKALGGTIDVGLKFFYLYFYERGPEVALALALAPAPTLALSVTSSPSPSPSCMRVCASTTRLRNANGNTKRHTPQAYVVKAKGKH